MKKILALLLVLAMVLALFAGCSDDAGRKTDDDEKSTTGEVEKDDPKDESKDDSKDDPEDEKKDDPQEETKDDPQEETKDDPQDEPVEIPDVQPGEETIAETVMFQDGGITVTALGLQEDIMGRSVEVRVKNDTDKDVYLMVDELEVNGVCISAFGYMETEARSEKTDRIYLDQDQMSLLQIQLLATIGFQGARLVDEESYETLYTLDCTLVTDVGQVTVPPVDVTGQVLADEAGIRVVSKGLMEGSLSWQLPLLVENETSKALAFEVENLSINGYTVSNWTNEALSANAMKLCVVEMYESTLAEQGIDKIRELTFDLILTDPETYKEILRVDGCQVLVDEGMGDVDVEPQDPTDTPTEVYGATLAETLAFDQDGIRVTFTGLSEDWTGVYIKVSMENQSDKNVYMAIDGLVVNGIFLSAYDSVEVAAGKKANGSLCIDTGDLELAGIDTLATISLVNGKIIDSDSYSTLYEMSCDLVTSVGEDYVQAIDQTGQLLVEKEGVRVISKGIQEGLMGPELVLMVFNDAQTDVSVEFSDVMVEGQAEDGWEFFLVPQGMVSFRTLSLGDSAEGAQTVSFTVEVTELDRYQTLFTQDVTADI